VEQVLLACFCLVSMKDLSKCGLTEIVFRNYRFFFSFFFFFLKKKSFLADQIRKKEPSQVVVVSCDPVILVVNEKNESHIVSQKRNGKFYCQCPVVRHSFRIWRRKKQQKEERRKHLPATRMSSLIKSNRIRSSQNCNHANQAREWAEEEGVDFALAPDPLDVGCLQSPDFSEGSIDLNVASQAEKKAMRKRLSGHIPMEDDKIMIPPLPHACQGQLALCAEKEATAFFSKASFTCIGVDD